MTERTFRATKAALTVLPSVLSVILVAPSELPGGMAAQ
jgi:hypothetical protein